MENVISEKRGLVLILVVATVVIFVGLVWVIATYLPLNLFSNRSPSSTASALLAGKNCTYPVSYWEKHPENYPAQIVIGGQVYEAKDLKGILLNEDEDLAVQLQAQLVGAYLNFLSGADQNYIETTIFEAYGWLVKHPIGSELMESDGEEGAKLFNILEAYNLGLTGVTPCEPASTLPLTETGTATETPTILVTTSPTPSETPTPTSSPTESDFTIIAPTRTAVPTTSVPVYPTSKPPGTLEPSATNTQVIPTQEPTQTIPANTSTYTPPPPQTPTYTPPPLPSPTYTSPPPP